MTEGDETRRQRDDPTRPAAPEDNSLGRLLTLSDGVFAIAMTLLALDLTVPDLGSHPSNQSLGHALAAHADSYWSYLLTFYVISVYWVRHRRLLRSVVAIHPALIRDTLVLLFLVAAMPFPASLLGRYGGDAISLAIYGGVNALATLTVIVTSRDVRSLGLSDESATHGADYDRRFTSWWNLGTFLLCIPAGYVLGSRGPYVLVLLLVPDRVASLVTLLRRRTSPAED